MAPWAGGVADISGKPGGTSASFTGDNAGATALSRHPEPQAPFLPGLPRARQSLAGAGRRYDLFFFHLYFTDRRRRRREGRGGAAEAVGG